MPKPIDNMWQWGDGSTSPIDEMDLFSCLKAGLHCMKRMRYYTRQTHFYDFKRKISENEKQRTFAESQISKSNDLVIFFAEKLDQLSTRTRELGTPMPTEFEDVKTLLSEKFDSDEKQTESVKEKAEEVNAEEEEAVNEYF